MTPLLHPGIHFGVPRKTYEDDPGINQSTLKAFAKAKTPAHFRYDRDHPPKQDKDFLRIGSALDTLIWSPSEFTERFLIAPATYPCKPTPKDPRTEKPWTLKSEWCSSWWGEVVESGKTPLMQSEKDQVDGMIAGLGRHVDIPKILENCERHVVLIAYHPVFGCRMKAEIDLWPAAHSPELGRWYFELKSDGQGADDPSFHKKCFDVGYIKQIAFYLNMARLAGSQEMHSCGVVVVESFAPYESKVHHAHYDDVDVTKEREWFDQLIPKYIACVESGEWPGYQSNWSKIRYPDYARRDRKSNEQDSLV
jgi:hypothetical protein